MGRTFPDDGVVDTAIGNNINLMMNEVAVVEEDHGFWDQALWESSDPDDPAGGSVTIPRKRYRELVIMEKVALVHSELSEFVEIMRKEPEKMSEKIPEHKAGADELADAIIRILGIAKRLGYSIGRAVVDKDKFNITRPFRHGKRF